MSVMEARELCKRLGIEQMGSHVPSIEDMVPVLEAMLNRIELLEKQLAAVQDGCAYIEPITDEEKKP